MILSRWVAMFVLALIVLLLILCSGVRAFTTYANVDANGITVSNLSRNMHDSTWIASGQINDQNDDGTPDYARDYSVEVALVNPLYLQGSRSDADLFNLCVWYASNKTCMWRTRAEYPTNPFRQIEIPMNNTNYSASRGYKIWTFEGVPNNMTNSSGNPKCSYGASAVLNETCTPVNWSDFANASIQFLQKVGAGVGGPWENNTIAACWNEPYGPSFFQFNATEQQRQDDIIYGCKIWQAALRAALPNIKTMAPSTTTGATCCSEGESMFKNFTRNTTGSDRFDYYDIHLYQYNGAYSLSTYVSRFSNAKSLAVNESVSDRLFSTETAWENTTGGGVIGVTGAAFSAHQSVAWMQAYAMGFVGLAPYRGSCAGNASNTACTANYNTGYYNTHVTGVTLPFYDALNHTVPLTLNMSGATLKNATVGNTTTYVWFVQLNTTYGRLGVWNTNNATLVLQNVTITGFNVTSVTDFYNASVQTINTNQSFNLSTIPAYGVSWYEVTANPNCDSYLGQPASVDLNRAATVLNVPSCLLTGSQPAGGKSCNSAGVCV